MDALEVEVTTQGPVGPWRRVGRWELERDALGQVTPFELAEPTWARFVRLSGDLPAETRYAELPGSVRVYERLTDEGYRSVIGEWGYRSSRGPLEWLGSIGAPGWELAGDAGNDAASATPLLPGATATDRAEIDVDEDWFAIETPPRDNAIEIVVQGRPSVGVALVLFDTAGIEQPMTFTTETDGSVRYQASIEPGTRYLLRVRQPPFSAVFTFDTSSSMGPFLDIVRQGIRTFANEVQPGREAVMIVPFEEASLLQDWEDDTYLLQDAVNKHRVEGGSSGAEAGLIAALDLLAEREGARAILLVTDAETSTYQRSPELWDGLRRVRPIVFSVHVGALGEPVKSRQLMQDWAAVAGGQYTYPATHGETDRAFDRMATWLRRPAEYRLGYSTADLSPGTLAVVAPNAGAGDGLALAPGVGIEVILDTSSSMNKKLGGRPRIDIAKSSLRRLLGEDIAPGVPFAIRTFGRPGRRKKARCATRLTLPLGPFDRAEALRTDRRLKAGRKAATPIAAALAAAADDLAAVEGLRSIVLVTDGKETCAGDPAAVVAALRESGTDVSLDIVGFALEDEVLKDQMAAWAEAGGGTYFDASGADELAASLATALSAPFRVYAPDGSVSGAGTVGGAAVEISPGTYRVEVLTDPPVMFDDIVVGARHSVTLELPGPEQAGSASTDESRVGE